MPRRPRALPISGPDAPRIDVVWIERATTQVVGPSTRASLVSLAARARVAGVRLSRRSAVAAGRLGRISGTEINETAAAGLRCEGNQIDQLRKAEKAKVLAALDQYDYLAWLFARGRVTLSDAKDYMAPAMIDVYRFGQAFIPPAELSLQVPYLERFARQAPKDVLPPDPCKGFR